MTTTEAGGTTVLRVVGAISFVAALAGATLNAQLQKLGNLEPTIAPNSAAAIISGDVMWTYQKNVNTTAVGGIDYVQFDVRVKRKLEDDRIDLVLEATAQTVTYSMWARALLIGA